MCSVASSNLLIIHPHETSLVVGLWRGTISFDILCLNEIWIFFFNQFLKGLRKTFFKSVFVGLSREFAI